MRKYRPLTQEEWLTYGEKVTQMKRILRELLKIQVPIKLREPPLLKMEKHLYRFCANMENEMLRQHPDMKKGLMVFFGDKHLTE